VCVQASSCVPSACAPLCRVQCTVSGGGLFTSEIISTHKIKKRLPGEFSFLSSGWNHVGI
jgi:hypothetical protein